MKTFFFQYWLPTISYGFVGMAPWMTFGLNSAAFQCLLVISGLIPVSEHRSGLFYNVSLRPDL